MELVGTEQGQPDVPELGRDAGGRGIILSLVSALLALLAGLALALAYAVSTAASGTRASHAGIWARLAAESGMDYAAARLGEEAWPARPAAPANRGDDWTFREGMGKRLEGASNPSYSHGEAWTDVAGAGGAVGVFDPNVDDLSTWTDLDGDGRFTAWSGRLRGTGGRTALTFALEATSSAAKVPVNDGFLDGQDRNGTGSDGEDNDQDGFTDEPDEDQPDCRDLFFLHHNGLAHVLNNLGAMLLPAAHPRRWRVATESDAEPVVDYSLLGDDLIGNRPAGGYRDARHLEETLARLAGGAWYRPEELAGILPYLDFQPARVTLPSGPPWSRRIEHALTWTPASPLELATASPVLLEAALRYLNSRLQGLGGYSGYLSFWESGAPQEVFDPRTGNLSLFYVQTGQALLYPDEAARAARRIADFRDQAGSSLTWNALYADLLGRAESSLPVYGSGEDGKLFRSGLRQAGWRVAQARFSQAKADLVFTALCGDRHPFPLSAPMSWSGWGIDRSDGMGGQRPFISQIRHQEIRQVRLPAPRVPGLSTYPDPEGPFVQGMPGRDLSPPAFELFRPVRFDVASSGTVRDGRRGAVLRGTVAVAERVSFTSQEDFENLTGGLVLAAAGIRPVNDAAWPSFVDPYPDPADMGRRMLAEDAPEGPANPRVYRAVVSLPRWPQGSYPPLALPQPLGYSRSYGALALASREGGLQGADLYWPFGERDVDTPQPFMAEPGPVLWKSGEGVRMSPDVAEPGALNPPDRFSPLHVTGAAGNSLQLAETGLTPDGVPGMGSAALAIEAVTVTGWLSTLWPEGGMFRIDATEIEPPGTLALVLSRSFESDPGVKAQLSLSWPRGGEESGLQEFYFEPLLLPDGPPVSHVHPFRITIARRSVDPPATEVVCEVSDRVFRQTCPSLLASGNAETVEIVGGDELRFYARELTDPEWEAQKRLGKFVRYGVYLSPLYVLDGPADLTAAGWTGIRPPAWFEAAAAGDPAASPPDPAKPVDPFIVEVLGYHDPAGGGTPVRLPVESEGAALAGLTGVRSFRYVVTLDARTVAGPLVDTPVFESIWIEMRRSRARWTRFERD